jgi:mannose-6-phosphate isomerase-like protein (cupin superfamily)
MRQIQTISENVHHTAVQIGKLDQISDYTLVHPKNGRTVNGKVFVKDATHATGTEISFTNIPPYTDLPYFHKHNECEETYIFLSGEGFFQVDDDICVSQSSRWNN